VAKVYGHFITVNYRESYDRGEAAEPGRAPLERFPEITCTFSSEPVALPYPDAAFDTVLSCGVLEHVQDPEASLEELHRVLRPGGRLWIVKLPNRHSYLERIARRIGLYYHGQLEHDTIYTEASARAVVARHGYLVHEVRLANMLPLTIDHPVATRLAGAIWELNVLLATVPVLNRLATNVEVYATRS
jgi:SAM-dependent methyltransferase